MKLNKNIIIVYSMLTLAAVLYSVGVQGFLQNARTFSAGLGSFAAVPTFVWDEILPYVSLIYLGLNVPLIIFFWKKNKKAFMIRTMYFLVAQTLFGMFFLIDNVSEVFSTLFGDGIDVFTLEWPVVIMGITGAMFIGFALAIAWKYGGSSGGSDILVYYYTTKKNSSIGVVVFLTSLSFMLFSFTTVIAVNDVMRSHWYIHLFTSLAYIVITSGILNAIYPKHKVINMTIISSNWKEIDQMFKESKYIHSWRIERFTSGYTGEEKVKIITTMYLLESRSIRRKILEVDQNVWISQEAVIGIFGKLVRTDH